MKGNSGRKLMVMVLFLALFAELLAPVGVRSAKADTVVSTVTVGSCPQAVAVNPATNKIYVANRDSNNVTVIDGATNSTTTVSVGSDPDAIAVNPVTNKIYVANSNGGNNGTVTVIDGATNNTATVNAGSYPLAIAVNPATNKIYVVNNSDANGEDTMMGSVTVIDGATNKTATVTVGLNPIALAVNPATNKIYVVNNHFGNDTVTVIDGATNSTATVSVGPDPGAIDVNPATNKIYVVNCGEGPDQTSPNWDGTVTVIDGATNSIATVVVGLHPDAVDVNPTTNKVYVTNAGGNSVMVIDGATISVAQKPISLTVGQNSYTADGQSVDMDVSPFISRGRAFVPVRYLVDALGAKTSWNAATQTVTLTKGSTTIAMTIGSDTLTVNGVTSWQDMAPIIKDGRTFLPVRWVSEAFGCTVSWDEATQTITVLPSST